MKIILSNMLALAIAGSPLLAQEPGETEKPKQQEPKKQPEPKQKQQPDEKPKPEKPKPEPAPPNQQKPDEQQPDNKERQKQQQEQAKREKSRPPQEQNSKPDHRNQQTRGKGQRIPPEKFRVNFGREHHFRVAHRDDRRFQHSGYWFEVVEAWPAGWVFDDDCFIEEDGDDYYLVDVVHPEIRVLVIVVTG
jgi:DNA mismatch repair ATPase MutL